MYKDITINECFKKLVTEQNKNHEFCNSREFESAIKRISDRNDIEKELEEYKTSSEYKNDEFIQFCISFVIFTKLRRDDRIKDLEEFYLTSKHYKYPICKHIDLLYKAETKGQITLKLVKDAYELVLEESLNSNIGVIHHYCLLVAEYYESIRTDEIERSFDDRKDDNSETQKKDINSALESMQVVLLKDRNYAKFHSTNGRLLALNGSFDQGLLELNEAIRLETGNDQQRSARIATYKIQKSSIEMMKVMSKINESSARFFAETRMLQKETQDIKVNNIKFLSIFTAILAFLTSGLAIFNETFAANKLFVLLVALFGLFTILFGIVFLVFSLTNKEKTSVVINDIEHDIIMKENDIKDLKTRQETSGRRDDFEESISVIEKDIKKKQNELLSIKKRMKIYNAHNILPAFVILGVGVILIAIMAVLVFTGIIA